MFVTFFFSQTPLLPVIKNKIIQAMTKRLGQILLLCVMSVCIVVLQNCGDDDSENTDPKEITVTTLAGGKYENNGGYADGQGTEAQFWNPLGLAADNSGNIYVADYENNRIRKITPAGLVSTIAGTGDRSFLDGPALSAMFNDPSGVSVDVDDNNAIYVADKGNNRIRYISGEQVGTVAGSTGGYSDGTNPHFSFPSGVISGEDGIFVVDYLNSAIRVAFGVNVASTIAGDMPPGPIYDDADGAGPDARFNHPTNGAIDQQGNLYIADTENNKIRKITVNGSVTDVTVTTLAGTGEAGFLNGEGNVAKFNKPEAVAVDNAGNIYVADTGNHRIRKITVSAEGVVAVTTFAGSEEGFLEGEASVALFDSPQGITVDKDGNVYVADTGNNRIRKITIPH